MAAGRIRQSETGIGNYNEAIVGMSYPELYVSDLVRDPANGKVVVNATTGEPSVSNTLVAAGRTRLNISWA